MNDIKIGSNRSFGIVFFIVFIIIGIYPLLNNEEIRVWSIVISLIFLILGLINSKFLSPLNKIWFKFGIFLGKIVSPLTTSKSAIKILFCAAIVKFITNSSSNKNKSLCTI